MKIYFTRHGQNDWNAANKVCGANDIPLNETGKLQAEALALEVANKGDIDIIVTSPLLRAMETAEIVSSMIKKPIIVDKRFTEWNYGKYEGVDRHGTYEEGRLQFQEAKLEFAVRIGETGESLLQLSHRVYSALDDIKSRLDGNTILIVAHGGVCRVIETYVHDMSPNDFLGHISKHCVLRCIEL